MKWTWFGLAVFVLMLSAAACFGGGGSKATPSPAETTAPGEATATQPAGTPQATPTPQPPFEVRSLRIIDDIDFPEGWHLVYESVPYRHGSGLIATHRAYRMGGELHYELLRNDLGEGRQARSVARQETGVPIVLSVCEGALCGYVSGPKPDVTTTFLQSDDLGVTWREIAQRPGEWWISWRDGKVLAMNPDKWDAALGNLIEPLDGSAPYRMPGDDFWNHDSFEPELPPGADRYATTWSLFDVQAGRDRNFAQFSTTVGPENTPRTTQFFAEFDADGRNPKVYGPLEYEVEGFGRQGYTPRPVAALGSDRFLVVADFFRKGICTAQGLHIGSAYAVLDLSAGTLAYIKDFVESTPEAPCGTLPGGGIVHLAFEQGTLWKVNTPGSCLNVRRTPSATGELVTCVADGVLLRGAGPVTDAGGRTWGAFHLPGAREDGGWAAMEFLTRDDQPPGATPSSGGI